MPIVVRPASVADLAALLSLYRELHPGDPAPPAAVAERVWASIVAQPGRTILLADVAGTPAGTADCLISPNLTRGGRPILFLENVVVARTHRRRGVGAALLAAATGLAEAAGCYKLQLLSADGREAHGFYRACGFAPSAQGFRRYLDPGGRPGPAAERGPVEPVS